MPHTILNNKCRLEQSGIRNNIATLKKERTITDKLIYTPNDDTQNYNWCLKRLDTQVNQSNFYQVPKVVKPTNKKTL